MINFVVFYLYFLSTTRFIQHTAPISLAQDMEEKRITQANKNKKKNTEQSVHNQFESVKCVFAFLIMTNKVNTPALNI